MGEEDLVPDVAKADALTRLAYKQNPLIMIVQP